MDGDRGDPLSTSMRGLYHYIALVARELGQQPPTFGYDEQERVEIYLALSDRLPRYPDRDLALLWDEENGWAIGIESGCGEALIVLAYLGGDILSTPAAVARFVATLRHSRDDGELPGQRDLPAFRQANDDDDLNQRLAAYAPGHLG